MTYLKNKNDKHTPNVLKLLQNKIWKQILNTFKMLLQIYKLYNYKNYNSVWH